MSSLKIWTRLKLSHHFVLCMVHKMSFRRSPTFHRIDTEVHVQTCGLYSIRYDRFKTFVHLLRKQKIHTIFRTNSAINEIKHRQKFGRTHRACPLQPCRRTRHMWIFLVPPAKMTGWAPPWRLLQFIIEKTEFFSFNTKTGEKKKGKKRCW